jgi:hypothetical protein
MNVSNEWFLTEALMSNSRRRIKDQGNKVEFWWSPKRETIIARNQCSRLENCAECSKLIFLPCVRARFTSAAWFRSVPSRMPSSQIFLPAAVRSPGVLPPRGLRSSSLMRGQALAGLSARATLNIAGEPTPAAAAFLNVMERRLRSVKLKARAARHLIPNRLSTGVRDHDELNLDRLFANSRNVRHLRCESVQHKASNQLMREAMGKHQGLGDAARNVGKPLQGTAFVECHRGLSSIERSIART